MEKVLLDTEIDVQYSDQPEIALKSASEEAANTGGVVFQVHGVRMGDCKTLWSGRLAGAALTPGPGSDSLLGRIKPRRAGNLYSTWESVLHPADGQPIGYLVLHGPILSVRELEGDPEGFCWATIEMPRALRSMRSQTIGAVTYCCCSRPISLKRLESIPSARFCTECKSRKESE